MPGAFTGFHYIAERMPVDYRPAELGDDAYGTAIREEIEATTGRKCSIGALYTAIDRLETKDLSKTWMGDATPQRGHF